MASDARLRRLMRSLGFPERRDPSSVDPTLLAAEQLRRNELASSRKLERLERQRLRQQQPSAPQPVEANIKSQIQPASGPGLFARFTESMFQRRGRYNEYGMSYGREYGKQAYRRQRMHNPLGAAIIGLLIYLCISVWPFPIVPFGNLWMIAFFFLALWAWGSGSDWAFIFLAVAALVTPIFGLTGVTSDVFSIGKLRAEEIRASIGLKNPLDSAINWIYKNYGWGKNPDVKEPEPAQGIQFLSFETKDVFQEKKPVHIDAKVQIDGFYDPDSGRYEQQYVYFSCYEEDQEGKRVKEGKVFVKDNPGQASVKIPAEKSSTHYVSCRFPEGVEIQSSGSPGSLISMDKGFVHNNKLLVKKLIVLEARMRMLQQTGLKLWTVAEADAPDDITKVTTDPSLDSDGRSKPSCKRGCGGPYFVTLMTGVQPITEAKEPVFRVVFLKNEHRLGSIAKLNSITFLLPEALGIMFLTQQASSPCDFTEDKTLPPERVKRVNAYLIEQSKLLGSSAETPLSLEFSCGYRVERPLERLGFHEVSVRADYDIVVHKRTLVDVYRDLPPGSQNKDSTLFSGVS